MLENKIHYLMLIFLTLTVTTDGVFADELSARDNIEFVEKGIVGSGWVNNAAPLDGIYVHGRHEGHHEKHTDQAVMVGKPTRQDYVFLSAVEQEGIWRYRQKQQEELLKEVAKEVAKESAIKAAARNKEMRNGGVSSNLKWPRVVVEAGGDGNKVCVPDLQYSEVAEWKEHLICTFVGDSNVH
jgi:hypothetical protein